METSDKTNTLPRKVFSVSEVSKILQTSEVTVRGYIANGKLKAFRIGRILISEKALDSFISDQENEGFSMWFIQIQ